MMDRRAFLAILAAAGVSALPGCQRRNDVSSAVDLALLDATDQAALIERGEISALEAVDAAIERIETVNPLLNAVITTDYERARDRARSVASGQFRGVPSLLKDLNAYKGMRFTRGSAAFIDAVADSQAPYTDRIEEMGVVILGKTNTPEFGLLPTTEPLALGPTRNPWDKNYMAGGSSGGTAAAIAARMVPMAQGSDGGGSIRIPAAMCGIFGLKPTRGRFPDQGYGNRVYPLSIKNMMSISVRDSALALALTESGAEDGLLPPVGFATPGDTGPLKIAVSMTTNIGEMPHPEIEGAILEAAGMLESMGHEIIMTEDSPLADQDFFDQFLVIWSKGTADVFDYIAYASGIDPRVSGILEPSTIWLAETFKAMPTEALPAAIKKMVMVTQSVDEWFGQYDAWLTPVTAAPAQAIGWFSPDIARETMIERVTRFAGYTQIHNAAGTPAMSVPMGLSQKGLPLAVQLSSRTGREDLLLKLAYAFEEAKPWAGVLPPTSAVEI